MDPFLGQIQAFGFNFAPRGWAKCEGQLLPISANTALFSLLGTTFGGDGRTTFALPDLRGRSIVGVGHGAGLSNIRDGAKGGVESVTLSVQQMPSHNHQATVGNIKLPVNTDSGNADTDDPSDAFLCANENDLYASAASTGAFSGAGPGPTVTINNNGGGQAVQIRNPYLGINVCIALQGIFPSRS